MSSVSTLPIIKNVSDRSSDYYGWLGTSGIFCCFKMCYAQIIKVCNFTSYFKLTPLMLLDSMTCRSHFHWTAFYYVLDSRNITLLDFNLFCLANVSAWQWLSWSYSKPVTWDHEIDLPRALSKSGPWTPLCVSVPYNDNFCFDPGGKSIHSLSF